MDIMEAILKEDETIEQTECDTMQSVTVDKKAKESETNVDTKVRCIFYMYFYYT